MGQRKTKILSVEEELQKMSYDELKLHIRDINVL